MRKPTKERCQIKDTLGRVCGRTLVAGSALCRWHTALKTYRDERTMFTDSWGFSAILAAGVGVWSFARTQSLVWATASLFAFGTLLRLLAIRMLRLEHPVGHHVLNAYTLLAGLLLELATGVALATELAGWSANRINFFAVFNVRPGVVVWGSVALGTIAVLRASTNIGLLAAHFFRPQSRMSKMSVWLGQILCVTTVASFAIQQSALTFRRAEPIKQSAATGWAFWEKATGQDIHWPVLWSLL